ncbi:right-handed parallel beta-helix repeat-containing protein [Ruegeria sp. HKCCC2117]|uniref:right-handed parallel beta-helix repeat-containing protein n=1 Tax=Ruegeria sp. HKCCC2117 TaxID=2682992 RepID=UPI001487A39F|nr:right-handed parallel beta-helix repeat-containing protein [Ruegeria sp. HKCCC2117]
MSTTITVSSAAELNQALSQATGGETILLAAGDYGDLSLNGTQFASTVTIKSADPNAPASFSTVKLNQASNITFDSINFDYSYSNGDYYFQRPFSVDYSSNITFTNSVFDGDYSGGAGTGVGLGIKSSDNVSVTNSEFKSWWKGVIATNSDGVDVVSTNIHSIRSDGLVFDNVDNILVAQNYFHDFGAMPGASDHRDMIQVQRANGSGSDNITIRDNIFDMGNGDHTQTIWMGGDGKDTSDPNVMHHNVLIQGNTIYNGHFHGISIDGANGLTITQNSVLHLDVASLTGGIEIPVINVTSGSKNVTIDYNIASQVRGYTGQSDWNVSNNALIQPGEYAQNFTYQATAQANGYTQYVVKPGSLADTLGAGSLYTTNPPGTSLDLLTNNTPVSPPTNGGSQPSISPTPPPANQPGTDQPTTDPDQPASGADQPDTGSNQPATDPDQPDTGAGQPIVDNQQTTGGQQPSTGQSTGGSTPPATPIDTSGGSVGPEAVYVAIDLHRGGGSSEPDFNSWFSFNANQNGNLFAAANNAGQSNSLFATANNASQSGNLFAAVSNRDGGLRDNFQFMNLDRNNDAPDQINLFVNQATRQFQTFSDDNSAYNIPQGFGWYTGGQEQVRGFGDFFATEDDANTFEGSFGHLYDLFA